MLHVQINAFGVFSESVEMRSAFSSNMQKEKFSRSTTPFMYILAYEERITKFDYGLLLKKLALCFKIRNNNQKAMATDIFEWALRKVAGALL
jgi:hypothetical protein